LGNQASGSIGGVGKHVPAVSSALRPDPLYELDQWGGESLVRGKRVLDLGCGDGLLTKKIVAAAAKQPLDTFIHESIVDPNKYVEKGYPPNVMPKTYSKLPAAQLHSLIVFLATPSG